MPEPATAVAEPAKPVAPAPAAAAAPKPDPPPAATPAPVAAPTLDALKAPDGLSPADVASFRDFARAEKLDPSLAQKWLDREGGTRATLLKAQEDAAKAELAALAAQSQADPDVGGTRFEASVAKAGRVLDAYFGPIAADLKAAGWDKHPSILRGLVAIADATGEPSPVKPTPPAPSQKSLAARHFPISVTQGFPES